MLLLCPLVVPITKVHQWQSTARMSCTYLRTSRFGCFPTAGWHSSHCWLRPGLCLPFPWKAVTPGASYCIRPCILLHPTRAPTSKKFYLLRFFSFQKYCHCVLWAPVIIFSLRAGLKLSLTDAAFLSTNHGFKIQSASHNVDGKECVVTRRQQQVLEISHTCTTGEKYQVCLVGITLREGLEIKALFRSNLLWSMA